jgi:hypothetical protein
MSAALLGFASIAAGSLLALLGVLRSAAPPAHQVDVEGLRTLLDETRTDREDLRAQFAECRRRLHELEQTVERMRGDNA